MAKTKVQEKAPTQATPQSVVQKQPETPEKQRGPARPAPSMIGALPPPNGRPPAARAGEMVAGSALGASTIRRAQMMASMQQTVGNARISRMMGTQVQAKLTVGAPDDVYEQEADRVADAVMRMPEPQYSSSVALDRRVQPMHIQRRCPTCEQKLQHAMDANPEMTVEQASVTVPLCPECKQKLQRRAKTQLNTTPATNHPTGEAPATAPADQLQRRRDSATAAHRAVGATSQQTSRPKPAAGRLQASQEPGQTPAVTPNLESYLDSSQRGGQPLADSTRTYMEPRFGQDFSGVRIHNDARAASAAQALNAQAFTRGRDIYFAAGMHSPQSSRGNQLLAHELTHVVQQTGDVQRKQLGYQRRVAGSMLGASLITATPTGDSVVQTLSWDDVTGTLEAGAGWVGEQAEGALEMGTEAIAALVARLSPELAELIRNGPSGMLRETIEEAIQGWIQGLLGSIDIGAIVTELQNNLTGAFATLQGVLAGDEASCQAFAESIAALRALVEAIMDNPVIQQLQEVFAQAGTILQQVANLVLAPIFDAVLEIAGEVFDGVKAFATTIWEWGEPIRDALSRAWTWVLEQLGIGGDGEDGILGWLKGIAAELWAPIQETFGPVIEPLKKTLSVLMLFSPLGLTVAAVQYGPQLIEAVQWLWNNKDNPDIVRAAHEQMGHTILPQLLSAAQSFGNTLESSVNEFVNAVMQIGQGLIELLEGITGVPLLSIAQGLIQTVSQQVQSLLTWGQEALQSAMEGVKALFATIQNIVKPYIEVLTSLAFAVANPGLIPVILAGWAWRMLPDCYKAPIIDFLLDIVIGFLEAAPSLPMFGLLWPMLKSFIIGYLQGVRNLDDNTKVAVTNKIAKIISGASPDFIIGFVKGLLKGLWEGLTDPFVLIYYAVKGLADLVVWLNSVADQALGAEARPATATKTSGQAAGAPAPTGGGPIPAVTQAELGRRMREMGAELQPPVEQVTRGFMPAVQEALSGGEGLTFEGLMQKLGEVWSAVEAAIRSAGGQLANKVAEFLMQDAAEGQMGEAVGWLTGTLVFEVVLAVLTAGSWTAASGAMRVIKLFAKILDWTGEVLGVAFKALAKVGGFILDGLKGLRKLLSNAGGTVGVVLDALGEIGQKLIRFADELLGRVGKEAAGEAGEAAAERGAKEGAGELGEASAREASERASREAAEASAKRGTREAIETAEERAARETAEQGGERGAREGAESSTGREGRDAATKAAEFPQAVAAARSIESFYDAINQPVALALLNLNTLKRRYRWIERFEARPIGPRGRYSIHMIASDTEIGKYDETDRVSSSERIGSEVDPGGRGRYTLSETEIGHLPAGDAERLRVLQSRLPASEAELDELVALRQRAVGGELPALPGTPEHMLNRWRQYSSPPQNGTYSFKQWAAGHPSRMRNSLVGPASEAEYRSALSKADIKSRGAVIETKSGKTRQVDILIERGPDQGRDLIQIKAGSESLTTQPRRSGGASLGASSHSNEAALKIDAELVAGGDRVTWVFEQAPTGPLAARATQSGIDVVIRVNDATARTRMIGLMRRAMLREGMSSTQIANEIAKVHFVEGTIDDVVTFVVSRSGRK